MRIAAEKAASQFKAAAKRTAKATAPRPRGRPKGSENKTSAKVELSPELVRIQAMVQALHKEFSQPLDVLIIVKTDLQTQACAHGILFSSDLTLAYAQLIDYYISGRGH